MYIEGAARKRPQNSHTLNALIYQADYAYKRPHNLDKSSLSNSYLWLRNIHPEVNMSCIYGEVSI